MPVFVARRLLLCRNIFVSADRDVGNGAGRADTRSSDRMRGDSDGGFSTGRGGGRGRDRDRERVRGDDVNPSGTITNGRLYIGNLDYGVDWKALKDHLKANGGAGNLIRVDVPGADVGARSKGYGIAEYGSNAEALVAMQNIHDTELNGRKMFAREDKEDKAFIAGSISGGGGGGGFRGGGGGGNRRIYVGNLSYEVQWQDLKDFCRRAGTVVHADVPTGPDGRSKGYGLVEFDSSRDAAAAIGILNEQQLRGRHVFVREDRE